MKFRLLENVLTTVKFGSATYFIYINPSSQELKSKEDSKENRAILDPLGNLYMEAMYQDEDDYGYSGITHTDLIDILHDERKFLNFSMSDWSGNEESLKHGLCLQRRGNTFSFYIAESYDEWVTDGQPAKVAKYFAAAKVKNPFLKFNKKGICEI